MPDEVHAGSERFSEDLRQLAAEAFKLAKRYCSSCRDLHMLWPYYRLAGAGGGDTGISFLHPLLADLLSSDGRTILIAGCADSGLLAMVARAAAPKTVITVLDRCETPLELCRGFARRWSLAIETVHLDLTELTIQSGFDVVLVHELLQFNARNYRPDILARVRRSLRRDGRLLLAFHTSTRVEGPLASEYVRGHSTHLVEQLEARKITLPEPREDLRRRAEAYSEERRAREGAFTNPEEMKRLIEGAGFVIEKLAPIETEKLESFRQLAAIVAKQRFVAVARPNVDA